MTAVYALLGLGRGLAGGVVGAVVGVILAATAGVSLLIGGLAGAGPGLVIGAVLGVMFQLPSKSEMLATVDEPGSATRLSVEVEPERRHDVAAVLEDSAPPSSDSTPDPFWSRVGTVGVVGPTSSAVQRRCDSVVKRWTERSPGHERGGRPALRYSWSRNRSGVGSWDHTAGR